MKLQPRKNSKHRRMIGTLGPHNPSFVTYRIPQAGQMGYHRRTQYNMRVLKIVRDPRTEPDHPGGRLPRTTARCALRASSSTDPFPDRPSGSSGSARPIRSRVATVEKVEIRYLSTRSKQGV